MFESSPIIIDYDIFVGSFQLSFDVGHSKNIVHRTILCTVGYLTDIPITKYRINNILLPADWPRIRLQPWHTYQNYNYPSMEMSASYEPYPKIRASYFSIEMFRVGLEVIIVKWASERSRENIRARVPLVAKIGT